MDEVRAVMEFIDMLLKSDRSDSSITQCDIGVVSPYKYQCKILRRYCEQKGYKNITIGSAETFQGQERKVMIISTVRSGWHLGNFLKSPQVRCFFFLLRCIGIQACWKRLRIFSEIQCDDYSCKKPFDCCGKSTCAVTRRKLVNIPQLLL